MHNTPHMMVWTARQRSRLCEFLTTHSLTSFPESPQKRSARNNEHANKLSEVQALPEVTKESRQIMAKSSFAIANAMKGLMKL